MDVATVSLKVRSCDTNNKVFDESSSPVWKSKFYGAYRVVLHAIDAMPARWRGGAGSSPLDGASTAASSPRNVHLTHWLISTQLGTRGDAAHDLEVGESRYTS